MLFFKNKDSVATDMAAETQLSKLVDMDSPPAVLGEVRAIFRLLYPDAGFSRVEQAFRDVVKLYAGNFPGYRECNTGYHDLRHTTDVFLAMARLLHGTILRGEKLTAADAERGLISALMHDTGYIQAEGDQRGTGAQYTATHVERSVEFMEAYFDYRDFDEEKLIKCAEILRCTHPGTSLIGTHFTSPTGEILGKLLGTADLLGQMADRIYLEKLLFLFYEFQEGKVSGYAREADILVQTLDFYHHVKQRLRTELGGVYRNVRLHFNARWNVDRDLYVAAVERNIRYLKRVIRESRQNYRSRLRRGGIVQRLEETGRGG